jgi:hypothetical protein
MRLCVYGASDYRVNYALISVLKQLLAAMNLHRWLYLLPVVTTQWDAKTAVAEHHDKQKQAVVDELHAAHVPWVPPAIAICGLYYDDPYYLKHQIATW